MAASHQLELVLLFASFLSGRCRKLGLQAVAIPNKARVVALEEEAGTREDDEDGEEEEVTMVIEAHGELEETRGVEGEEEVRAGAEVARVEEKKALAQVGTPF